MPHRHNGPMSCECVLKNFMNRKSERLTVQSESDLPQSSPKQVYYQAHYLKVAKSESELATIMCSLNRLSALNVGGKGFYLFLTMHIQMRMRSTTIQSSGIIADTASVVDSNLIPRSDPDPRCRDSLLISR